MAKPMRVALFALLIVAFALFIRARTRVLDRYQLLDLAIFAVSTIMAVKLLVLDPMLDANPPVGTSQPFATAYALLLLGCLIMLIRFAMLRGARPLALWCLVGAFGINLVGAVLSPARSSS